MVQILIQIHHVEVSLPIGRTANYLALVRVHSCAILDDGSTMCWGYNTGGQLGDGTYTIKYTVNLPAGRTATALALGRLAFMCNS